MAKILTLVLGWFANYLIFSFFKFIFSGAIGLASYKFITIIIDRYISQVVQELGYIGDLSAMVNISQFDVAISIILSAYAVKGSILAMGLFVIEQGGNH